MVVTLNDVTDQFAREAEIRMAHETLDDAIESLDEGFALYDAEDRLITSNSRYRNFNKVCADIIQPGMRFRDLVETKFKRGSYYGDADAVEQWLKQHKERRFTEYGVGYEFKQSDGRWVHYVNQPDASGRHGRDLDGYYNAKGDGTLVARKRGFDPQDFGSVANTDNGQSR